MVNQENIVLLFKQIEEKKKLLSTLTIPQLTPITQKLQTPQTPQTNITHENAQYTKIESHLSSIDNQLNEIKNLLKSITDNKKDNDLKTMLKTLIDMQFYTINKLKKLDPEPKPEDEFEKIIDKEKNKPNKVSFKQIDEIDEFLKEP